MIKQKKDRNLKYIDGKWYLDFTFNKKRIRKFGGYTKEQARNVLAKERMERLNEKLGFKKPSQLPAISFEDFSREFIELYAKQNKKSWRRDEESLKNLRPFLIKKMLRDIEPALVENYKAKRKAQVSEATVNRELALLKTILNKAVEWGRLESNRILKVKKFKETQKDIRVLQDEEAIHLIDAALPHLRPVLIMALNTGMRKTEILSLKWEDVDFKNGLIFVKNSKSADRKVPMNYLVFETLNGLPRSSEFVFYNPKTRSHIGDVKNSFKAACDKAKIKGLRFHDLRHTAASRMIQAGVDLVTVSRILGHSSIQMTMRYVHSTTEIMRNAVEKLSQIYEQTRQNINCSNIQIEVNQPAYYSQKKLH